MNNVVSRSFGPTTGASQSTASDAPQAYVNFRYTDAEGRTSGVTSKGLTLYGKGKNQDAILTVAREIHAEGGNEAVDAWFKQKIIDGVITFNLNLVTEPSAEETETKFSNLR